MLEQDESLECEGDVAERLAIYNLRLESVCVEVGRLRVQRVRYMVVSNTHNFVLERDFTFRQVAAYAQQLGRGPCVKYIE